MPSKNCFDNKIEQVKFSFRNCILFAVAFVFILLSTALDIRGNLINTQIQKPILDFIFDILNKQREGKPTNILAYPFATLRFFDCFVIMFISFLKMLISVFSLKKLFVFHSNKFFTVSKIEPIVEKAVSIPDFIKFDFNAIVLLA